MNFGHEEWDAYQPSLMLTKLWKRKYRVQKEAGEYIISDYDHDNE